MTSRRLTMAFCAAAVALALSACGGGNGGGALNTNGTGSSGDGDAGTSLSLPAGHGLTATGDTPITVPRGGSTVSGNVVISCPRQAAADCSLTVEADGTAAYSGGMPRVALATGGNDVPSLTVLDKWRSFAAGNPSLRMTSQQVAVNWRRVARKSTHSVHVYVGGDQPGPSTESPDDVEPELSLQVYIDQCSPGDCDHTVPEGSTVEYFPVLEHNTIPIAGFAASIPYLDEDDGDRELLDLRGYGGWLDYTAFRVQFGRTCDAGASGCSGPYHHYDVDDVLGLASGMFSGTTPTGLGSATWTGVMVGMESPEPNTVAASAMQDGRPDVYLGDAQILIDNLAAPDVDVSFTNIHNVTEGTRRRDMSWKDLPMIEGGVFGGGYSAGGPWEYIAGMFNGPRHQEVGGHFRRDGIAGAFGARRR